MEPLILVVDDQESIRVFLEKSLGGEGYRVATAGTGEAALALVEKEIPDLVLLDMQLPDTNGLAILHELREHFPHMCVVIVTAFSDVRSAVDAIKSGAYDYIEKPINVAKLLGTVEKGLEASKSAREVYLLKRRSTMFASFRDYVPGRSKAMEAVYEMVRQVSSGSTTTVLIGGESGVGKDLVASLLHATSQRAGQPFLDLNCASLPDQLLESELFGHEKGAFTDAFTQKPGLMELAHKGTLFLDEIGEMALPVQAKFLRVLEKMSFRRLGGIKDITVDVRIIAATNQDLRDLVAAGRFREDLYYRLEVVQIVVPPLRERIEDIAPLADHFVGDFSSKFGKEKARFSEAAVDAISRHDWPGNIRELRNMCERVVLLAQSDVIDVDLLGLPAPEQRRSGLEQRIGRYLREALDEEGVPLETIVQELERALIMRVYEAVGGNQSQAARLLGMKRDKLRYRMERYDLGTAGERE